MLINYQHPDDTVDSLISKAVVVFSLTLAEVSVLMFPLDVGNRRACTNAVDLSWCALTMPMRDLWYTVWMIMIILAFAILPWFLFFHETDTDHPVSKRAISATIWAFASTTIVLLCIGIPYAVVGYSQWPTGQLGSGTLSMTAFWSAQQANSVECTALASANLAAVAGGTGWCNAENTKDYNSIWPHKANFLTYSVAVVSIIGWLFVCMFAGVGAISLPMDWFFDWYTRPRKVITKTEYISRAKTLGRRAKELQGVGQSLRREEMAHGRSRKWRKQVSELTKQIDLLQKDDENLTRAYPQGEERATMWMVGIVISWLKLFGSILGGVTSFLWILHMILYLFVKPPVSPFLNDMFIGLQNAWGLLGVFFFSLFCLYIVTMTIHGLFRLGFFVGVMTIHPMKLNGTFMPTFFFNCAVISILNIAIVQFCSWAFGIYADDTTVQTIFNVEVRYLNGFGPLYDNDVFQWILVASLILAFLWFVIRGVNWRHKKGEVF